MWSPVQERALDSVGRWIRSGSSQVFHLFGFAGTGKTTLAKHLAESVSGRVLFAAYTGKAAHVLQTKGCAGATTIHSLIYHSREKGKTHLRFLENRIAELTKALSNSDEDPTRDTLLMELEAEAQREREALKHPYFVLNLASEVKDADLVIIDECSMVDAQMGSDLLSFGTKVLVLGDPAQLPPPYGAGYFTENVTPDVMLDEVHRQAADSPILRMATQVRQENMLEIEDYGDNCRVVANTRIEPEEALQFNQIIVGRNKTRHATNRRVRTLLGHDDPYPLVGDRLVCLRNNHDEGLLNGAAYSVVGVSGIMDQKVLMDVIPEGQTFAQEVLAHEHFFLGRGDSLPFYERKDANEFDYGYAFTVHKAQGSQWDRVLLFDESFCFRKDRFRWLYTGITRAAKELTIVKM